VAWAKVYLAYFDERSLARSMDLSVAFIDAFDGRHGDLLS